MLTYLRSFLTPSCRLQEETARVEEHLLDGGFTKAIIKCFTTSKANAFENLLEPLQKLLRLSPPIALSLAQPDLFSRILQKLQSNKALTRLNLLRIVQSICDASDEQGALINIYGLYEAIQRLAETDTAILVRDMAGKLIRSCEEYDKRGKSGGKRRPARRASSSTTPPSLMPGQSVPPTPTSTRSNQSSTYFVERDSRQRSIANGPIPFRTPRREETTPNGRASIVNGSTIVTKSRLPRTTSGRTSRQSMLTSPKKEENHAPSPSAGQGMVPNSRRRRQVSGDTRWS